MQRDGDRRIKRCHRDLKHLGTREHPRLTRDQVGVRRCRCRHEGLRGEVAEGRILLKRHVDDALDLAAFKHGQDPPSSSVRRIFPGTVL